ncbi:DUF3108 domain-containing protein [Massilia aurea]|uniref:DUF3108 domain-containing protein n=1 Tax=Massilia aurea TaxID=373040 RepID=UPI0034618857
MRLSVFHGRHALLPILFLLSLALHLLVFAWFDPRPAPRAATAPLAVTLTGADPAPAPAVLPTVAPPVRAPQATPKPASQPRAPAAAQPAPPSEPAAGATGSEVLPTQDGGPPQRPSQYRTASHDSLRIDYRVSGMDADSAHLSWETDGSRYRLELDGIVGEMASEGGLDDAGIAPRRTRERLGTGQATTLFDRERGQIVDGLTGRSAQLAPGSQDDASVLMQLSGMGQADPDQLRSRVAFWVGGLKGARMVYFESAGPERLDTGIGPLDTVRLVRLADSGAPQLEVWLAPANAWLPVQLRLTETGGVVRTQTVVAISATQTVPD